LYISSCWLIYFQFFSVNFELEPGAVGHTTDFKEANKRLEWGLKKVNLIFWFSINSQFFLNTDSVDVHREPSVSMLLLDDNYRLFFLLQVVGGSEHTLRAKLTFSQELHGIYNPVLFWPNV
jgi:AP-4 complex subunit mu-1